MFTPLHTLENLIQPVEAYERSGGRLTGDFSQITGQCPFCGHTIWFTRSSWLCCNDGCQALTGSSLEIVLGHMRDASLQEALNWMLQMWAARCRDTLMLHGDASQALLLRAYRLRRAIIRWVRGLKKENRMSAPKSLLMESLSSMGLQKPDAHVFHPASADDIKSLCTILDEAGCEYPRMPRDRTLLVVPFGPTPHEITTLTVMDVASKWQQRITLCDMPIVFSGLWHLSQNTKHTYVCMDPVVACQMNQKLQLEGSDVAVSCQFSQAVMGGGGLCELPASRFVLESRNRTSVTSALRFTEMYPDALIQVSSRSKPLNRIDFCVRTLEPHVDARTGAVNGAGLMLMGLMHPQGVERTELLNAMNQRGWHGACKQISHERYVVDLIKTDKGTLVNTPEGYSLRKRTGQLEMISNFTVQFVQTVTFDEHLPYYRLCVHFGRRALHTIVPSRMLESPKEMTEHLQLLASVNKLTDMPYVQDNAAFKQLSHYWRALLPKLEVKRGMAYVGWDARFESFQMPGCQVTADGTFYEDLPMHPDIVQLDVYSSQVNKPGLPPLDLELPRELRTLILMIVGAHIQVHRRVTVRPVQLRHDGKSIAVLENLFRGLGQVRPIARLQNRMIGVQHMPAFAMANQRETGAVSEPFFILTDLGIPINGTYSEITLARAASTLRRLIIQTTELLLGCAEPHKWQRPATVLYTNELILTAQQFLRQHDIDIDAELTSYEYVERLLKQVPKEAVEQYFSYDFSAQIVTLRAEPFRDTIDFFRLECELRSLADNVRVEPNYVVRMDAYSAINLLQQYYGSMPDLKPETQNNVKA